MHYQFFVLYYLLPAAVLLVLPRYYPTDEDGEDGEKGEKGEKGELRDDTEDVFWREFPG